jgi:transcriptional regulator with XRE-family HTH domain
LSATEISKPNPVDVHVGSRVRLRRTLLGMTQGKLGDAVSLTFQQIQKYERGANRIGSSRLYQFSQILDVPVSFFFDDMPGDLTTGAIIDPESNPALSEENQFARRETLELVRAYYAIESPAVRKRVFELVKVVAGLSAEEDIADM